MELIDDCVHCGFCLPTCPTYVLWGEEMDSPRGRIVLMKEGTRRAARCRRHGPPLRRCLGCMACVTACPSGVQYDKLIEDTRAQVERHWDARAGRRDRSAASSSRSSPTPAGCARSRRCSPARAGSALAGSTAWARALRRLPRLRALAALRRARRSRPRAPAARATARGGAARGSVALLQGCVQRVFFARGQRRHRARAGGGGLGGQRPARARAAAARWSCTPATPRRRASAPRRRSPRSRATTTWSSTRPAAARR